MNSVTKEWKNCINEKIDTLMYCKNLLRLFEELMGEIRIPKDAKIYIKGKNINKRVKSVSYDLDDWDDHGWTLDTNKGDGIDITDEGEVEKDLISWKKEMKKYINDINFGKLYHILCYTQSIYDEIYCWDAESDNAYHIKYEKLKYDKNKNRIIIYVK